MADSSPSEGAGTECPVCGYCLASPPWTGQRPSHQQCPACGIRFGDDDIGSTSGKPDGMVWWRWQINWIEARMPWRGVALEQAVPADWDPVVQLQRIGINVGTSFVEWESQHPIVAPEFLQDWLRVTQSRLDDHSDTPVAFEARWDGDTQGWGVCVAAVYNNPGGSPPYHSQTLAFLRAGGDLRLFNHVVPPWPEANLAQALGSHLADLSGVPFFFPSPQVPDDDCPHWWEQDQAKQCPNCGKMIMRAYHNAELCYTCSIPFFANNARNHEGPNGSE